MDAEPLHAIPIDFLIVTALPEERDALLKLLDPYGKHQSDEHLTYYVGTIAAPSRSRDYRVAVLMLSRMGNADAGIDTTRAIRELRPACVLMVGIAGGIGDDVNLGDVLVSSDVIYYEQGKETPDGLQRRWLAAPVDAALLHSAQNYNSLGWRELIDVKRPEIALEGAREDGPHVHFGPIAVGEKVLDDEVPIAKLKKEHPRLIGVEMESYGVAQAAAKDSSRPRFLDIRGVSDLAVNKTDTWREYAAASAAAFAIDFLRSGPLKLQAIAGDGQTAVGASPGTLIAIQHLSMEKISSHTVIDSLPAEFKDFRVVELPIDQTDLYNNGRLIKPREAVMRQVDLVRRVDDLLVDYPEAEVGYFGIAHIPLLFHAGYCLTNKRKLRFFELNRYTRQWELLQGDMEGPELRPEALPSRINESHGDVVLRVSVSNTIRLEESPEFVTSPITSLHLSMTPTQRDVLVSERQLYDYGAQFRQMLDRIHEFLPNRERLHIFYTGPVSLAVHFGQLISPTIDRRVLVYNYTWRDRPVYSWALEITADLGSEDFFGRFDEEDR